MAYKHEAQRKELHRNSLHLLLCAASLVFGFKWSQVTFFNCSLFGFTLPGYARPVGNVSVNGP
jgi:hypothetical protein